MASRAEWDARRRRGVSWATPLRQIIDKCFSSRPREEKELVANLLVSNGIVKASDLRDKHHHSGHLVDWGVPEWFCKGLVSKELVDPGMPRDVREAAVECEGLELDIGDSKFEEDGLMLDEESYVSKELEIQLQSEIAKWNSWWHLASGGFDDPEEEDVVTNLFKREEVAILYGFRALLRIIIREAPVQYRMISRECFIGSFYFMSSSGGEDDKLDWSQVVWMLQAVSEEVSYDEAVGRLIVGVRRMFEKQPGRKLAFGVVAGYNFVHVYAFRKPAGNEKKLLPSYMDQWMLTYYACHTGLELLVHFLCLAPAVHGFVEAREAPPTMTRHPSRTT